MIEPDPTVKRELLAILAEELETLTAQHTANFEAPHGMIVYPAVVQEFHQSGVQKVRYGLTDGSEMVYTIVATLSRTDTAFISVLGPIVDNNDEFWAQQLSDRSNAVVIGNQHYRIGDENSPSFLRGHGGREFQFRMLDTGQVVTTTNLWSQGTIPPAWRSKFPPTAEFLPEKMRNDREILIPRQSPNRSQEN